MALTRTLITAATIAIILILDWLRKGLAQFLKDEAGEVANGDWPHLPEGLKAPARKARGVGAVGEQRPSGTINHTLTRHVVHGRSAK